MSLILCQFNFGGIKVNLEGTFFDATECSTKFQINVAHYGIIKYFKSFQLLITLLQFLFWNSRWPKCSF